MKTLGNILLSALFLLMPWCMDSIYGQSNSDKKITIIKRSIDSEGSEVMETIVKKGKAAENFDVDAYIRDNRSEKTQVEVRVEEDGAEYKNDGIDWSGIWNPGNWSDGTGYSWSRDNDRAFLGVEEDSDEDRDKPGIKVQIVRGSAADLAGLRTNDVILSLDGEKINRWSEITRLLDRKKPGDVLKIGYSRAGVEAVAEAKLTTRGEVNKKATCQPKGFLGVSEMNDYGEEGVKVSITRNSAAEKAGLVKGDVILRLNDTDVDDFEDITDFMSYTKPEETIKITWLHNGDKKSGEAMLGTQKSWDWEEWSDDMEDKAEKWSEKIERAAERAAEKAERAAERAAEKAERLEDKWEKDWEDKWEDKDWDNVNFNIKDKDACLGVYTEGGSDDDDQPGTRITDFTEGSAARESQMQTGDIITAVNGHAVEDHDDLWDEVAKYKPGEKVTVTYLRKGNKNEVETVLKPCRDNSSKIQIMESDENGEGRNRQFMAWNWGDDEQARMKQQRVITIHKGEGDAVADQSTIAPNGAQDRSLSLRTFKAYPNPTAGQITVEFRGDPVETVVTLFDLSGRQLFREELNAFDGNYFQQFDLTEHLKGTVIIRIQQGDKVFTEQILVNN